MKKPTLQDINAYTSFHAFAPMASRWLQWQCKMISEVKVGTVFIRGNSSENALEMLSQWPEKGYANTEEKMRSLAEDVMSGQHTHYAKINCELADETMVCDAVTLPLRYNDTIVGAVIFLQSVRSEEQKQAVLQLFRWGCAWLESALASSHEEKNRLHPLVTDVTRMVLEDEPIEVSGHRVCNLLAEQLECTRVVLGLAKGLQMQTVALSHQLRFDKQNSPLLREIEVAMEEAIDQNQTISYPKFDDMTSVVVQKHQALSSAHEDAVILTIPFATKTETKGAILFMRPRNKLFTEQETKVLEHTTELMGSALALKLRSAHSFFKLFGQGIGKRAKQLFGNDHWGLKLGILGLAALFVVLSVMKTEQYTYAKSTLEGSIRQLVVAPQDGFIETSDVRAGDKVARGQTLVRLDDRDLILEQKKLLGERDKINKEYREALALRERAKVSILSAQIKQVDVQLDLVGEKLQRSVLKAPFEGIVVSGDLSQSLGAPVEKGTQLFEISPLGDYRVAMHVDDHDISTLQVGQKGSLRLIGLPYDPLGIHLSRITPLATAQNGGNFFRVEAEIDDMNKSVLRPGMQGIAKVAVGQASVLWVWTHSLFERLRLWFWSVGL